MSLEIEKRAETRMSIRVPKIKYCKDSSHYARISAFVSKIESLLFTQLGIIEQK